MQILTPMKKKMALGSLYFFYYLFMPFVFVDCGGVDVPYVVTQPQVTDCDQQKFLTEECAKIIEEKQNSESAPASGSSTGSTSSTSSSSTSSTSSSGSSTGSTSTSSSTSSGGTGSSTGSSGTSSTSGSTGTSGAAGSGTSTSTSGSTGTSTGKSLEEPLLPSFPDADEFLDE